MLAVSYFFGLSYVIRKDLCEARVNLEVCSYLADEPSFADGPPCESRIDALNTTNQTWQMYLLWPMDPPGNRVEMP